MAFIIANSTISDSMKDIGYIYKDCLPVAKVRVRNPKWQKEACPARVAEAGQENIETVHGPKPIQAADTL